MWLDKSIKRKVTKHEKIRCHDATHVRSTCIVAGSADICSLSDS